MLELTVTKQFGVSACCTFHTPDTCFIKNYDWKVNTQEERYYPRPPTPQHTHTTHIFLFTICIDLVLYIAGPTPGHVLHACNSELSSA